MRPTGMVALRKNGRPIFLGKNMIVDTGLALIATLVSGSGTAPSHMAIGDDGSAVTAGDADLLGDEHERVAANVSVVGKIISLTGTFGAGLQGNVTVREMGIFNDGTSGTMLARIVVPAFTLTPDDELAVLWQLEMGV